MPTIAPSARRCIVRHLPRSSARRRRSPNLTVEVAIKRRKNLQARITSIESEYLPALPAEEAPSLDGDRAMPKAGSPGAGDHAGRARQPRSAPSIEVEPVSGGCREAGGRRVAQHRSRRRARPRTGARRGLSPKWRQTATRRGRKPRRRPYAAMFIAVTLFAAAAIAGWWAFEVGLFKLPSEIDTSVHNPPTVVEGEDFDPDTETPGLSEPGKADDRRNWITVFAPSDSSSVSAPSGATAEVSSDEAGAFLRIRSGESGAAVIFDVGQGILEQIAGKKAVFDIVARAEDGKETRDFGRVAISPNSATAAASATSSATSAPNICSTSSCRTGRPGCGGLDCHQFRLRQ